LDPLTQQTHDPDIFAGGDAVTGPKDCNQSNCRGQTGGNLDWPIHTREDLSAGREKEWQAVREVPTDGYDTLPRAPMPVVSPEVRTGNFEESAARVNRRAGEGRSGALSKLRRVFRVLPVRGSLPGERGLPRSNSPGRSGLRRRNHRRAWLSAVRPFQIRHLRLLKPA